jgi:hypothetical protein
VGKNTDNIGKSEYGRKNRGEKIEADKFSCCTENTFLLL